MQLLGGLAVARYLEESESEPSLDELDGVEVATLILALVSLIVLLSVGFELLKEKLFKSVDETFEPVVEALFSELTTLGALSLLSYILVEAKILDVISDAAFGINVVSDAFELVHMGLFLVAIIFMLQVAIFLHLGAHLQETWNKRNETVQDKKEMKRLEGELAVMAQKNVSKRNGARREKEENFEFYSLRQEFILERSPLPPFAPKPHKDQLKQDFEYGKYLTDRFATTMASVVEVPITAWVCLWGLLCVFYCIMLATHSKDGILMWVWGLFGWVLLASLAMLHRLVTDIRSKMINPAFMPTIVKDSVNGGSNGMQVRETSPLQPDKAAFVKQDVPYWTTLPFSAEKSAKSFAGRFLGGGALNRQEAVYFLGKRGAEFHVFTLRLILFLNSIYLSVLFIVYEKYAFDELPLPMAIGYTVASILPSVLLVNFAVHTIGMLVHVNSIGVFRNAETVRWVVRVQKTARAMHTLLLINRLRLSMSLHGGHLEETDPKDLHDLARKAVGDPTTIIGEDQVEEIGRAFDMFDTDKTGSVNDAEVQSLLRSLGMVVSDADLRRVISTLDLDNSGTVDRAEFIWWYAKQQESAPADAKSPKETLEELFSLIDHDNSGVITLSEMVEALDRLDGGLSLDEVADLFREMDDDKNGTVEREEFVEMLLDNMSSDLLGSTADT